MRLRVAHVVQTVVTPFQPLVASTFYGTAKRVLAQSCARVICQSVKVGAEGADLESVKGADFETCEARKSEATDRGISKLESTDFERDKARRSDPKTAPRPDHSFGNRCTDHIAPRLSHALRMTEPDRSRWREHVSAWRASGLAAHAL